MIGYGHLFTMIATSMAIMFALMYLNSYAIDHIYFSETRSYMAIYMGAMMAVVMLAFMLGMYPNRIANVAIFSAAAVIFAGAVYLVRSQATVEDVSWMEAMIPHHSIASMTSERADINDPRVQKLAEVIITAQELEVAEMKALIADLNGGPSATPEVDGK